ncbi:MAG TPA: 3'(2'),5'-bisphosphate nucleotidase CysQ [Candidatus Paceibacterota bacterium]|nr:3'(2'),5'-bisphosphate nucleotidase CysQ [Candidatus Paceibacterota bacterium]
MPTLDEIVALTRQAGDAALALRGALSETKQDGSPVTAADRASHDILMAGLARFGYPIVSEESLDAIPAHETGRAWIVDPLDGTSAFLHGTPEWAAMVALVENGEPILAVVYAAQMGALWSAEKGGGAYAERDGKRQKMSVSEISNPHNAKILLSKSHQSEQSDRVAALLGSAPERRGGLGIKACFIAERQGDLYWTQAQVGEWDACAPQLILTESGGAFTDARGERIRYVSQFERPVAGVAASNGLLHEALTKAAHEVLG